MKKLVLLSAALLTTQIILAQNQKTVNVYFDVDEHYLTEESVNTLDKLIEEIKYYDVKNVHLAAHTDHDASDSYNQALSERRANSVSSYLYEAGIRSEAIESSWFGERKPAASNSTDEGKQLNRRVELRVKYQPFLTVEELFEELKDPIQTFRLNAKGPTTIVGLEGVEVIIPEDAFMTLSGKPVANKDVHVELEEALDPGESYVNQLSTESNGELLETGGMMRIDGFLKKEKLKLREGKSLTINIPNDAEFSDMTVFAGERGAGGVMNWVNTARAFEPIKAAKGAAIKMDKGIFDPYLSQRPAVPLEQNEEFSLKFPKEPVKPTPPRTPYAPKRPNPETVYSGLANFFYSKERKERRADELYAQSMRSYNARMEKYHRFQKSYSENKAKYEEDLKLYSSELDKVHQNIKALLLRIEERFDAQKKFYDQAVLSRGIKEFIQRLDQEQIYTTKPINVLSDLCNKPMHGECYNELSQLSESYRLLEGLLKFSPDYIRKNFIVNGELKLHRVGKKHRGGSSGLGQRLRMNEAYNTMIMDPKIQDAFGFAIEEKLKQDEKDGILNDKTIDSYYSAVAPNVGWINCDRFSGIRLRSMVNVGLVSTMAGKVMVYVNKLKSMINGNGGSVRVPKGTKFKAIFLGVKEGKPHMYIQEAKAEHAQAIKAEMEPMSLVEIKTILDDL